MKNCVIYWLKSKSKHGVHRTICSFFKSYVECCIFLSIYELQLHEKKCIFIFHGSFCPLRFMELYFFWVWNDNSSLVNCLPKRFLLSELLKFWDKKHTSSLVWYVVCIENVYFSICRCVCSNRWDFQFLVSSSFLFQRFLVAVIDNLIFSLLRSLDPLHMLWHMTFHTTRFLQHWTITGSFSTLTFLCCCDSSTFYPRF